MVPFFYLILAMLWALVAYLLFFEGELATRAIQRVIPWFHPDNLPWLGALAVCLLAHNLLRCWIVYARLRARKKAQVKSQQAPTAGKVVDPTFRFTDKPSDGQGE